MQLQVRLTVVGLEIVANGFILLLRLDADEVALILRAILARILPIHRFRDYHVTPPVPCNARKPLWTRYSEQHTQIVFESQARSKTLQKSWLRA